MSIDRRKFVTIGGIDRREFLTWSGGIVSSAAFLAACDSRGPKAADKLLKYAERKNAGVETALFRHTAMDKVRHGAYDAGNKLPSYFVSPTVPVWDEKAREVGARGQRPRRKSGAADSRRSAAAAAGVEPRQPLLRRRLDGSRDVDGVPFRELANLVRVAPEAHYVDFQSFDDDYHESWDLESAMHPQTVVAYGLDGKMLEPAHGAPARVYSPVKLGYKNTKYLTKIVFMPKMNGGYWSDMGYEWYGGV